MTIANRTDSDGNDYQIWAQEQTNSCTIASIWMARALARQMSFQEDEWSLAYRLYHSVIAGSDATEDIGPQTFNPASHSNDQNSMGGTFSRFGVIPRQIAAMMRQEGFGVTMAADRSVNFSKLGPTKPALVGIRWQSNASGSWQDLGGHRIVAARKSSNGQVVFLDPAGGGRLMELDNNGRIPHPNRTVTGFIYNVIYIHSGNI